MATPMIRRSSPQRMMLTAVLSVVGLFGWCLYGLALWEAAGIETELQQEIATLQAANADLARQAKQAQTDLVALVQLRQENTSARSEIERLTRSLDQAQAELATVRSALAPSPDPWTASQMANPQPAAVEPGGRVESAQQALTGLGYGPLAADGILGPATRVAIERFQGREGLAVTGELDDETWRRLQGAAGVAATQ